MSWGLRALRNFANRTVVTAVVTPPLPFESQLRPSRVLADPDQPNEQFSIIWTHAR